MSRLRSHLTRRLYRGVRWVHIHIVWILVILLVASWAFLAGREMTPAATPAFKQVPMTKVVNTGYQQGPLPPLTQVVSGPAPYANFNLSRYLTRQHNQGASYSCVGQTLATSAEIVECERYKRNHPGARSCPALWFSSGWFWNPFNGGNFYSGISYGDAYARWQADGAAPISEFAADGWNDWWLYPPNFTTSSYRYHIAYFRQIASSDRTTIESYLDAGIPIGLAAPWYTSLADFAGGPTITQQWGAFKYWHSVTIVGYTPIGVIVQNSFGAGWGNNGQATLSWNFLIGLGGVLVAGIPANSLPPFKQITRPGFPLGRWSVTVANYNQHHPRHKHHPVSPYYRKHLGRVARNWWRSGLSRKFAGPGHGEQWNSRQRFMLQHFPGRVVAYSWPTKRGDPIRWTRAGKTFKIVR